MPLQDRTEPATQRRREEAREEGRVARSTDVNSAAALVASLLVLRAAGPYLFERIGDVMRHSLNTLHTTSVNLDNIMTIAARYGVMSAELCLPIIVAASAVGLAANVLQVGFRVASKPLVPDLSRIDPIKGLARMVSRQSFAELVKSAAKVLIVGWVVYAFLRGECPRVMELAGMSPLAIGQVAFELCWRLLARACAAMLIIAAVDYIYQRVQFESALRMTKQEVKEEYKRTEGDPVVRSRIRQRQREMARRRMMQDVARSHVVITNPTHLAVALRYDPNEMDAPTVTAKGQRLVAERIKELARIHGIPLVENPPVAQMLYKMVDVGQQIPEVLYRAVAEILAMIYRKSAPASAGVRTNG